MTYGVDILPENDPNMQLARDGGKAVGEALRAGSKMVDILPVLKYLPAWFPGASFQKVAERSRTQVEKLREGTFAQSQQKWVCLSYIGTRAIIHSWRSYIAHLQIPLSCLFASKITRVRRTMDK